jgi:2-polyprenyl-3-methyl-5-hydroxy-6-metoxy-1,4-benzoquinol methylase
MSNLPAYAPTQLELADAMFDFAAEMPASIGLEWVKDRGFLFHFEAARLLLIRQAMLEAKLTPAQPLRVLDFGYLHGLIPEFVHRFFPQAHVTVHDHPDSPNFKNPDYLALIRRRNYLTLLPRDINGWQAPAEKFDVVILGELIEHLDPTVVAKFLEALRTCVKPDGVLIITTPNGAGLLNAIHVLLRRDNVVHAPIPIETMNYGHIHLWPPQVLTRTARHYGWQAHREYFFHGLDGGHFANLNRHWGSARHQVLMRLVKWLTDWKPAWRGYFVASFTAAAQRDAAK